MKFPTTAVFGLAALASASPVDLKKSPPNDKPNADLSEWMTVHVDQVNKFAMHTVNIKWNFIYGECRRFEDHSNHNINKSVVWTICNDMKHGLQPIVLTPHIPGENSKNVKIMPKECKARILSAEKQASTSFHICNNARHLTFLHFENKHVLSSVVPVSEEHRISSVLSQKVQDKLNAAEASLHELKDGNQEKDAKQLQEAEKAEDAKIAEAAKKDAKQFKEDKEGEKASIIEETKKAEKQFEEYEKAERARKASETKKEQDERKIAGAYNHYSFAEY